MSESYKEPDWKAMYLILFRGICDALELGGEEGAAAERLIQALQDAESYYMDGAEG